MARLKSLKTFEGRLAVIALLGLFIRLIYTGLNRKYPVIGDALTFHKDAAHLAAGEGFRRAFEHAPTAEHPPLHIVWLALIDLLGGHGTLPQKFVMCFVGTGTIVALAFLGRRLAGPRAGLIAAFVAAVYPLLWVIDGSLMSETTYALLITLMLIAGLRYLDAPSWPRAAVLGVAICLATYTRGEAIGFLPLLAAPLAFRANATWRARIKAFAVMVLAFVVLLAPWTTRNLLTFKDPVLISTNGDGVFVGADCWGSFYGELKGSWDYSCFRNRGPGDESQYSKDYRERGIRYARAHERRIPKVVAYRLLREFDFYRPTQSAIMMASEGRYYEVAKWGIWTYWVLFPLFVIGAILLRRRRDPALMVLMAPVVLGIVVAIVVYGSTRFRVVMEPVIVVLAAVAVDAFVGRVRARGAARRGQSGGSAAASSAPASATPTSVSAGISQSQSIAPWKT
jgi:4-amino-4-deoxy-L-arabinose transferase-like glycosyltransferase